MALLAKASPDNEGPPPPKCAETKQLLEWLPVLCQGNHVEVRAVGVTRQATGSTHTETTVFRTDDAGFKALAKYAREISPRAEGVYFTLNPFDPPGSGAVRDVDVLARKWLLIDVDPVRPAGTSATEHEKQAAWQVAFAIRNRLDDAGWPEPILADSGNGWHLLYRIDLPAADGGLVAAVLKTLAGLHDTASAKVDTTVGNPSRICKLYGTIARKGEPTPDRPHRTAWINEYAWPLQPVPAAKLQELVRINGLTEPAPPAATQDAERPSLRVVNPPPRKAKRGIIAKDRGSSAEEAFGRKALDDELRKLASTPPGSQGGIGRNNQLFRSAAALFEIVAAGALDEAEVVEALRATATQTGLKEDEVRKTIDSARRKGTSTPRDLSHVGKVKAGKIPTVEAPDGGEELADDPHRLARVHRQKHTGTDGNPRLAWWNGEWWSWTGTHWRTITDRELAGDLVVTIREDFARIARETETPPRPIGSRLVGNVALALQGELQISRLTVRDQPAWLDTAERDRPDPAECLPTLGGILHLPTLMEGGPRANGAVIPPTSRFFSQTSLSYAFDPAPPVPDAWLGFLNSLWPDDPETIACLQEWFGYLLTPDTSQQKILMLIGPKRSGKGTITRTLEALIGRSNIAAPTLTSLASPFGGQDLIGKSVAICPESRITGRADTQAIVERLLSISGEDPQSIPRKHLTDWTGYLKVRFVLLGNELPRLGDYSGAMTGRLVLLKMTRSFFGQEDTTLQDRIRAELPGILMWALAGWKSLRDRGRFHQPASGAELLEEFEQLSNPVGAFLSERVDVGPEHRAPVGDVFEAWRSWCEGAGRHPGDVQTFSRNLRTVLPDLDVQRPRNGDGRARVFVGLRVRPEVNHRGPVDPDSAF